MLPYCKYHATIAGMIRNFTNAAIPLNERTTLKAFLANTGKVLGIVLAAPYAWTPLFNSITGQQANLYQQPTAITMSAAAFGLGLVAYAVKEKIDFLTPKHFKDLQKLACVCVVSAGLTGGVVSQAVQNYTLPDAHTLSAGTTPFGKAQIFVPR